MNRRSWLVALTGMVVWAGAMPAQGQTLFFETPVAEQCIGDGTRQFAAIITGRGFFGDWVQACRRTTATINGQPRTSRDCRWAGTRVWGKFDVPDASCNWNLRFLEPVKEGCSPGLIGMRQYAAIITGDASPPDWVRACRQTTVTIDGAARSSRNCAWAGGRVWGKFDVPDPTCGVPPQLGFPPGSYLQSCIVTTFAGDALTATCRTWDNQARQTSLTNVSACVGDIANVSGTLRCDKGAPAPQGSYRSSCRFVWYDRDLDGGTLGASCDRLSWWSQSRGPIEPKPLTNVSTCVGDIFVAIKDGWTTLLCSRAPLPRGSYEASCRKSFVEHGVLWSECRGRRSYEWSSLNLAGCTQDIANEYGRLICGPIPTAPAPSVVGKTLKDADDLLRNAGVRYTSGASCIGFTDSLKVEEQRPPPGEPLRQGDKLEIVRCSQLPGPGLSCPQPQSFVYAQQCNRQCTDIQLPITCEKEGDVKMLLQRANPGCTFTTGGRCRTFDLIAICPGATVKCHQERQMGATLEAAIAAMQSSWGPNCKVTVDTGQAATASCR